jgi:diguanylate cyclase (GGDEF)-like protein
VQERITVTHQLREKIVKQKTTNNALTNLLSSTDIVTLNQCSFWPPRLCIKHPTPGAGDDGWVVCRIFPYRTQGQRIDGDVVNGIDITECEQAEIAMQEAQHYAEAILETIREPLIILDEEYRVVTANAAFYRTFLVTPKAVQGFSLYELDEEQWNLPALRQLLEKVMLESSVINDYEAEGEFSSIGHRTMLLNARQIELRPGRPKRILLAIEDVTLARKLSAQMHYEARHDLLTGLENRREFEYRLARVVESARNNGTEHALMYLDLDRFKVINDSCGHAAGDELLRQIGSMLSERVRARDMAARLGGDEFGVVLEHCSLKQAQHIGESLCQAIEAFVFVWGNQIFRIGASIGLVAVTSDTGSVADLLKAADAACYAAKDSGRNRLHVYYQEDTEPAKRHGERQWAKRVRQAIEENRFRLYNQCILPLDENAGDDAHYEILVRLIDEQDRLVLPEEFLGAAERYDLAISLDRWVVSATIDWLTAQPEHLERLTFCNINLSAHSIVDETFLELVLDHFKKNPATPHKICFEITETAAIANIARANRFIQTLKQLGCHFALDDFGSGLASFAHLKTLPVDFLKIDGAFVRGIVEDPVDLEMVKCINCMAQATGKQTIAEFVENDAILQKLRGIGVDYAQGYAIGRPQPLTCDASLI